MYKISPSISTKSSTFQQGIDPLYSSQKELVDRDPPKKDFTLGSAVSARDLQRIVRGLEAIIDILTHVFSPYEHTCTAVGTQEFQGNVSADSVCTESFSSGPEAPNMQGNIHNMQTSMHLDQCICGQYGSGSVFLGHYTQFGQVARGITSYDVPLIGVYGSTPGEVTLGRSNRTSYQKGRDIHLLPAVRVYSTKSLEITGALRANNFSGGITHERVEMGVFGLSMVVRMELRNGFVTHFYYGKK